MHFVKTAELKPGMRLARPIFNRNGLLLYDQGLKIDDRAILRIENFRLLGVYILDPAEPARPMTDEDFDFEHFLYRNVALLQTELPKVLKFRSMKGIRSIAVDISRSFCRKGAKLHFFQTLRSYDDWVYRSSLNIAIIAGLIAHQMELAPYRCEYAVCAALLHEIGLTENMGENERLSTEQLILKEGKGIARLESALEGYEDIFKICSQTHKMRTTNALRTTDPSKFYTEARILLAAKYYDLSTAIQKDKDAQTDILTIKQMIDQKDLFGTDVVRALVNVLAVVTPGVTVELNTGDRALVLSENPNNVLRPVVLLFRDNTTIDLSQKLYEDIYIVNSVETLDDRYKMIEKQAKEEPNRKDEEK